MVCSNLELPGLSTLMRHALVFAHFDPHGVVDPHVLYALACYRPYFESIIFVSTADLDRKQQDRVAALADCVIVRTNVGYDFLSWRAGFEAIPSHRVFDSIAFTNDSCYGPISDFGVFWQRLANLGADLWGASINRQIRPHVQSFFMVFHSTLIRSGFARSFWTSVEKVNDKTQLILRYEVGLSQRVEEAGFRIGAIVDYLAGGLDSRQQVVADTVSLTDPVRSNIGLTSIRNEAFPNPVQNYCVESLRRGLPFVKVELIRDNFARANLMAVFLAMTEPRWYDVSMVHSHLSRLGPCSDFPPVPSRTNAGLKEDPASWDV